MQEKPNTDAEVILETELQSWETQMQPQELPDVSLEQVEALGMATSAGMFARAIRVARAHISEHLKTSDGTEFNTDEIDMAYIHANFWGGIFVSLAARRVFTMRIMAETEKDLELTKMAFALCIATFDIRGLGIRYKLDEVPITEETVGGVGLEAWFVSDEQDDAE